ncbi:E3 ubiquitin-protein ligase parkin-like [Ornithodoros turicata]
MDSSSIVVKIKFVSMPGGSLVLTLNVKYEWSVKEVKEHIASQLGLPVDEIKVIFSGKELHDNDLFRDCDVGQHTTLHAVRSATAAAPEVTAEMRCPLSKSVLRLQLTEEEKKTLGSDIDISKVHFFVYCGSPCSNVVPAKLRVRCSMCKQGTLVVSRDPSCWEDVLEQGKISGTCQREDCTGKMAEFFFKCASHPSTSTEESSLAVLHLIKNNFLHISCLSCTEISQIVLVFPCESAHVICLECFQVYCRSRLDERRFIQDPKLGYTLPCPVGCENSLIKETHHFHLLGSDQYQRYLRFGAEESLLQSGGVLCPRPGCGAGILPDRNCNRVICGGRIEGQGCGFVFCKQCLQGYHIGPCIEAEPLTPSAQPRYEVDEAQADRSRWESASRHTIWGISKPCPKCRTPTERDGGCMHMVCTRPQCGYHWCWICQVEWSRECQGAHWFG